MSVCRIWLCKVCLCVVLTAPCIFARVKTGLDVLVAENFSPLAGKRLGVIANRNARTWDHRDIVSAMLAAPGIKVSAIFVPEHGYSASAQAGADIESGKDAATGVPVFSLYKRGSNRPSDEMLRGVDALVYDLQESGARFWTFTTTLGYMLEAAAKHKLPIYVLDRPNPINGIAVEGPMLDPKYFSMIGYGRRPVRHGMTVGELARMFNVENAIGADLHVVKMEGWRRGMFMDETGLEWINPSPNLRNLTATMLYPGTCLVENTVFSVGRGTDTPFQMVGAPWLKALEIADYLNARKIPGVRAMARKFTPAEVPYKGEECNGLDVQLLRREDFDGPRFGLELLAALLKFHPDKFTLDRKIMLLLGNDRVADLLKQGLTGSEVSARLQGEVDAFQKTRQKYLLY